MWQRKQPNGPWPLQLVPSVQRVMAGQPNACPKLYVADGLRAMCDCTTQDGAPCGLKALFPDGRCTVHTDYLEGAPQYRNKCMMVKGFLREVWDKWEVARDLREPPVHRQCPYTSARMTKPCSYSAEYPDDLCWAHTAYLEGTYNVRRHLHRNEPWRKHTAWTEWRKENPTSKKRHRTYKR
jgi:hypothetical protein